MIPASQAGNPIRIAQTTDFHLPADPRQTLMGTGIEPSFPAYQSPIILDAWQSVCLGRTLPNDPGGYLGWEPLEDSVSEGRDMASGGY